MKNILSLLGPDGELTGRPATSDGGQWLEDDQVPPALDAIAASSTKRGRPGIAAIPSAADDGKGLRLSQATPPEPR